MTASYKILFTVQLLNDYYKDGLCKDFTIVPAAATVDLLKRYQLLYKVVGSNLLVLAKTDTGNTPLIAIESNEKFAFYLSLNKPAFVDFTNVDLSALPAKRFYFSNINQNKQGAFFNLTQKIAVYKNDVQYKPGDLADDGTNTIYECIGKTKGNNTSTAFWTNRGSSQFVSSSDMLLPSSKIFNYIASAAVTEYKIAIFSLDKTAGTYTRVVKTETQKFVTATTNVQVDFSAIQKGKYRVKINADELLLYVDDEFVYGGYFGVIEVFSHLPNTNEFSFFSKVPLYVNTTAYEPKAIVDDGSSDIFECLRSTTGHNTTDVNFWKPRGKLQGIIKEITYSVRFSNRRAFWKYITRFQKVENIKVKGSHDPVVTPFASFSTDPVGHAGRKDFFLSNQLLPISEKPDDNNFELMLAAPLSSFTPPAPKADTSSTGMLTQANDQFFCNIYLNY